MIVLFLWWTEQEVERAFSEFHRMYERNRAAAESLHKNEEALKKAWGFKGKEASHGVERKHRSPGSIGGHGSEAGNSGGVKKGKRMARRLGGFTTTTRNLDVISVDAERGLLIVKGTVPGPNRGIVTVREAVRLNRRKQTAVKAG